MNRRRGSDPPGAFFASTRRCPQVGEIWHLPGEAGSAGLPDPEATRPARSGTRAALRKALLAGARLVATRRVLTLAAGDARS